MEDTMYVVQVFPEKPTNAGVVWYGFISSVGGLVAGGKSLDTISSTKGLATFGISDSRIKVTSLWKIAMELVDLIGREVFRSAPKGD